PISGRENAGRQQVEGELLVANDHRVTGVVAAVELHDVVDARTQQVRCLALAFVAPLGADDYCSGHSCPPSTCVSPRESCDPRGLPSRSHCLDLLTGRTELLAGLDDAGGHASLRELAPCTGVVVLLVADLAVDLEDA